MHISNAISSSTNVKNGAAKWCWFKVFCTQFGAFKFAFDNSFVRISNFVLHLSLHLYCTYQIHYCTPLIAYCDFVKGPLVLQNLMNLKYTKLN